MRISYLNGEFLPHESCRVHIEDRGCQFADGVYEVVLCVDGKFIDEIWHLERMMRSLSELSIKHYFDIESLIKIQKKLFDANHMQSGICYIQITRGQHARFPGFPKNIEPTIFASVAPQKSVSEKEFASGFSVMTHEDIRWKRCDIKSLNLLASSFVNQKAKDFGFDDAVFVREGFITEATYANVFIVDSSGTLITRMADDLMLAGITRKRIIQLAKKDGFEVVEKNFSVSELKNASEAFLTSSSLLIRPVLKVDNEVIFGQRKKTDFSVAKRLKQLYDNFISC